MSEELKCCPFCGGDAEMDSRRTYRNLDTGHHEMAVAIYCRCCAADISICIPDVPTITTDEVRAMWNTRHTPDIQAAVDALLEIKNIKPVMVRVDKDTITRVAVYPADEVDAIIKSVEEK